MEQERFLVFVPPHLLGELRGRPVTACHLAYRMGEGPHLLAAGLPAALRGGLMAVTGPVLAGGQAAPFLREVAGECRARGFSGAVFDPEGGPTPFFSQLLGELEDSLAAQDLALYVPEEHAQSVRRAGVLISTALSGGSLELRLRAAAERFGRERTVAALQRASEDFALPALNGSGRALSPGELERLRAERGQAVFFSPELCARYFTYMDGEGGAHFVLFDDAETMARKAETARRAGLGQLAAAWPEIRDGAAQLGLAPRAGRGRR